MLLTELSTINRPFHWYNAINEGLKQAEEHFRQSFPRLGQRAYPTINAYGNAEGAILMVELPGLDADDVSIEVEGNTLKMGVERKPEEFGDGEKLYIRERWHGKFSRTLDIPFKVEEGEVKANFSKGILYIHLPKAESEKPKKITIHTE